MKKKKRCKSTVDRAVFTCRLNTLFDTIHPPDRGPFRNVEVSAALARRGDQLSAAFLSQLRREISNPSPLTVHLLAEFFGVRTEYLNGSDTDYTRVLDRDLHWLRLARNSSVRHITTALLSLPANVREDVLRSTVPRRYSSVYRRDTAVLEPANALAQNRTRFPELSTRREAEGRR